MKAERKEMDTNASAQGGVKTATEGVKHTPGRKEDPTALEEGLKKAYDGLKQGPSRGTMIGVAVVLAAALLVVLFYYFWTTSSATDSRRWVQLDEAMFASQLNKLLDDKEVKDTPQHRLARYKEARMKLSRGLRELGNTTPELRKDARKNIETAIELYETLAKESARIGQLHQEALWGAAKGYEALGGSENLDNAIKRYETLAKEHDQKSALVKDAKKQLERLNTPAVKETLSELSRALEKR